jgi:hypothetical protein
MKRRCKEEDVEGQSCQARLRTYRAYQSTSNKTADFELWLRAYVERGKSLSRRFEDERETDV